MAPDTASLSSPRWLTLQHAQKTRLKRMIRVAADAGPVEEDVAGQLKKLDEGQAMLYSFFGPALSGGKHTITSSHDIRADGQALTRSTTKSFTVRAPQYTLPEGAVHSCFPPPGSMAQAETLPHLLLSDPFLPWEREAQGSGNDRERMPWLALLVFSQDELQMEDSLLNGTGSVFEGTKVRDEAIAAKKPIRLTTDFAINLPVEDFSKIHKSVSPVPQSTDPEARSNAIFVKKRLFDLLTTPYNEFGTPVEHNNPDIMRYKHLAHVRHSRAKGMQAVGNSDGLYSVVHAHRIGSLADDRAGRAVAHLVSLEGWTDVDTKALLAQSSVQFVVLSSLFSWSFTTMPADAMNVEESLRSIGEGSSVLGPPADVIADASKGTTPQAQRIQARLRDGYTLTKYHTQTGELTTAIMRGALTPTLPPRRLGKAWSSLSFSGQDLQIFDKELGLMDLTYSTAWNLGKTMALADQVFTTSLSRIRHVIFAAGLEAGKAVLMDDADARILKKDAIKSLPSAVGVLGQIARGELGSPAPTSARGRSELPDKSPIDISTDNPVVLAAAEEANKNMIRHLVGSSDKKGGKLFAFFNELNSPNSTDWTIVLSWVMDKMYLFGIPAQYLLIESSWLPDESLRSFYIDPHWIDAFIDGALSLANHISRTDDTFRRLIKGAFNAYFRTIDPETGYRPQIPSFGFFLRSHLVQDFPDLLVTAPFPPSTVTSEPKPGHERAPVLRHERLAEDTLLCLFDRTPGEDGLQELYFTQPAHQQSFAVGDSISSERLEVSFKRTYTVKPEDGKYEYDSFSPLIFKPPPAPPTDGTAPKKERAVFVWGEENEARFLNMTAYIESIKSALAADSMKVYNDDVVTSALVGYQLGLPVYRLHLTGEDAPETHPSDGHPPQLMMLGPRTTTVDDAADETVSPLGVNVPPLQTEIFLQTSNMEQLEPPAAPLRQFSSIRRTASPPKSQGTSEEDKRSTRVMAMSRLTAMTVLERPLSNGRLFPIEPINPTGKFISVENYREEEAHPPKFTYKVFPLGFQGKPISCSSDVPQDLVFSIRLNALPFRRRDPVTKADKIVYEYWTYGYNLQRIVLSIPMGAIPSSGNNKATLLERYRGPGPVMLSNLRLNVIMSQRDDFLEFTLLPRSTKGYVSASALRDCSFVLPLVEVNRYIQERSISMEHREEYVGTDPQGGKDPVSLQLVP